MGVTHFPMGAPPNDDFSEIARMIVDHHVTVLIGMPSTLHRLFFNEQELLQAYGGIDKVFLGGEHPAEASLRLMESCGVVKTRSAIYGSVDAGPLGHACAATANGVFHLMCDTQHLEIVHIEQDVPVRADEVGRLLFTSRAREGQDVHRYDVGDTGRWVPGACPCGLESPRFEIASAPRQVAADRHTIHFTAGVARQRRPTDSNHPGPCAGRYGTAARSGEFRHR